MLAFSPVELKSFGSVEFGEVSVESSQRKVAGFPRCFEDQTIGEPQRRAVAILLECCRHAIGLLNGKISVMQKHVDGGRDFRVSQVVHSGKNPCRFHENQRGHPCPFTHERFRGSNLLGRRA